jgi:hypothetical protein
MRANRQGRNQPGLLPALSTSAFDTNAKGTARLMDSVVRHPAQNDEGVHSILGTRVIGLRVLPPACRRGAAGPVGAERGASERYAGTNIMAMTA